MGAMRLSDAKSTAARLCVTPNGFYVERCLARRVLTTKETRLNIIDGRSSIYQYPEHRPSNILNPTEDEGCLQQA